MLSPPPEVILDPDTVVYGDGIVICVLVDEVVGYICGDCMDDITLALINIVTDILITNLRVGNATIQCGNVIKQFFAEYSL